MLDRVVNVNFNVSFLVNLCVTQTNAHYWFVL